MRESIKKKMEENLIKADINEHEEQIDRLIERSKKIQEFANQCVVHIQDGKITIENFYIEKIGSISGRHVMESNCHYTTNSYKITSDLFKNINIEQNEIRKKINRHNKQIDKLKKKLKKGDKK